MTENDVTLEEAKALLAAKEAEAAKQIEAEKQQEIAGLENEMVDAEKALKEAKDTQSKMVAIAKNEGRVFVDAAKATLTEIKNKIRAIDGKVPVDTRTKSAGFGARKRDEVVLAMMGEFDGPVKASVVAERILADGLYVGKETSLTSTVCTALNALAGSGDVNKLGKAQFELA